MAPRTIWKGSISFGLVNIPIGIYIATEDKVISFNQLDEKGHKIHYKKWCEVEEREIPYEEIQKGYEVSKDNYVVIDKSDFEKVKIKTTKTIDIKEFVDAKYLDPIFVERSYYIAPDTKTVSKAYQLFANVLSNTHKIAIGKVVLKDKERLIALRPYQRGLVMHLLHYLEEIRPIDEITAIDNVPKGKVDEQEISLGKTLVENLTAKSFDPSKYSDVYTTKLKEMIEAKSQGKMIVVNEQVEPESGMDLLEALKASVSKSKKKKI